MLIKIITPVSSEPVSHQDVKQHLRLPEGSDEDDLLLRLIMAAREYAEHYTRQALAEQTLELILDRFPKANIVPIPCPPLRNIHSITVRNDHGVDLVLDQADFLVDADAGQVVLKNSSAWLAYTPYPVSPIRIRFTAGYETLPPTIRQAILLLIGHWYENREATGTAAGEIAFSVHALLAPYRVEVF